MEILSRTRLRDSSNTCCRGVLAGKLKSMNSERALSMGQVIISEMDEIKKAGTIRRAIRSVGRSDSGDIR